jgi:hypothetical protein
MHLWIIARNSMKLHKSKPAWRIHIIILGLLCIASLFAYIWYTRAGDSNISLDTVSSNGSLNIALTRKALEHSINSVGSENTYRAFKKVYQQKPIQVSHSAAHLFGEALYRYNGIQGITVCDSDFGFGCYHSFFGKAIGAKGVGIIQELDRICVEAYGPMGLGCPHGIGHGLGEYMGSGNLTQQLELCETLTWKGRFFGCKGGVFMEYNMPLQGSDSTFITAARTYDGAAPYGACLSVPVRFQPACFLELSSWWEQVLNADYTKIGLLCKDIVNNDNKDACFLGVGYAAGPSRNYSVELTVEVCDTMPDVESQLLCRAGASWSFFANPPFRPLAPDLCAYENSQMTRNCKQKSDLLSYK